MSDEDEDEVPPFQPQDSKCNSCKYGMCVMDKDLQSFVQPSVEGGNPFEGQNERPSLTETSFEMNKTRSLCFWHPIGSSTIAPIVFNVVSECNRYAKD